MATQKELATVKYMEVLQAWNASETKKSKMTIQRAFALLNEVKETGGPLLARRAEQLIGTIVHRNVDTPPKKEAAI